LTEIQIRRKAVSARNDKINHVLIKLFKTYNTEIINECRHFFGIE